MAAPIREYKYGPIQVAVWENEAKGKGETYKVRSVTTSKSYKDKDGNWQQAKSFQMRDLPDLIMALQEALKVERRKDTPDDVGFADDLD